jgi:hypothetical protein
MKQRCGSERLKRMMVLPCALTILPLLISYERIHTNDEGNSGFPAERIYLLRKFFPRFHKQVFI